MVHKVCGSGMKATMLTHDLLAAGNGSVMVAGGMESMSNAPYLLEKARSGYRLGHGELKDHMFLDGLEDAYEGHLMGVYAEDTAQHYQFTREAQDAITEIVSADVYVGDYRDFWGRGHLPAGAGDAGHRALFPWPG